MDTLERYESRARMIIERYWAISMAPSNSHVQDSSQPTVLDIANDESSLPDLDTVLVYPSQASTEDSEFCFLVGRVDL
jgi:hypothetical protein